MSGIVLEKNAQKLQFQKTQFKREEGTVDKPKLIAICGKSCSGKDTLAKALIRVLESEKMGEPITRVVSCTTRPPRPEEKEGIDYFFVTPEEFYELAESKHLLDYTQFRGWHYGHPKASIKAGYNIAIFDPAGLQKLAKYQDKYDITVIYLSDKASVRLARAHKRENRWHLEYFRRLFTDWKDFKYIYKILSKFPDVFVYDKNTTMSILSIARDVVRFL